LANLEVAPQGIARQTEADTPSGLTRGTFKLELEEGLNMISLPVQPDNPMTSKSLANEIGATLVIHLDPQTKAFVPFVPEHFESTNFEIQGGMGVIVNVRRSQTVNFTGTVWDNTAAAPGEHQPVWAFGLVFEDVQCTQSISTQSAPTHTSLSIRNLRSDEQVYIPTHTPATAFVDQSQQAVVNEGDTIEIQTEDLRWRYRLTGQGLQNAFAQIVLDQQIQVPNRTQLLQNYPNPFNPETWIPFELSRDTEVTITIYDVSGQQIRQLDLGLTLAGRYLSADQAVYWNGKTQTGEWVASGTYFHQIQTEDYTQIEKMVILK